MEQDGERRDERDERREANAFAKMMDALPTEAIETLLRKSIRSLCVDGERDVLLQGDCVKQLSPYNCIIICLFGIKCCYGRGSAQID